MKIPGAAVRPILIVLYIAAAWVRMSDPSPFRYPYFNGESATNYRQVKLIADHGHLPDIDERAAWPDGYAPALSRANGVEYTTAFLFRLVAFFSDTSVKKFTGAFLVLFFCLSVFVFYALTYEIWTCQAASFFSAFLIAFSAPVVDATNGREFLHATFASVLIALHVLLFLKHRRRPTVTAAAIGALVVVGLMAAWEVAVYYTVLFSLLCLVGEGRGDRTRKAFLLGNAAAVVIGSVFAPHLLAQRALFSAPVLLVLASGIYVLVADKLPRKVPGIVYAIVSAALLTVVLGPFHRGGVETPSAVQYWLSRLRYLFGKPDEPLALSTAVRYLWTHDRSYPTPYQLFRFFVPLLFLIPGVVGALRQIRRSGSTGLTLPFAMAGLGAALFLLDDRAVLLAATGVFPLAAVALFAFREHAVSRAPLVGITALLIATHSVFPYSGVDVTHNTAARTGVSTSTSRGFLWVSLGNADQELVRFIVSRTSVRDAMLAPPRISPLIATFGGRKTLFLPGIHTRAMMDRTMRLTSPIYATEDELYEVCSQQEVKYLVYSIDYLLDTSTYSPAYMLGRSPSGEGGVVWKLHFAPQSLEHFSLVYENDNYRVFRITKEGEPVFITDHPPVYQLGIYERHGDNLDSFYERVVDILATYGAGAAAQAEQDYDRAARHYRYCVDQAPQFTKAWLGLGACQIGQGNTREASDTYLRVLAYAPDNTEALYYAASTLGEIGDHERALDLLDVLLVSTNDRQMLRQAQELQAYLRAQSKQ